MFVVIKWSSHGILVHSFIRKTANKPKNKTCEFRQFIHPTYTFYDLVDRVTVFCNLSSSSICPILIIIFSAFKPCFLYSWRQLCSSSFPRPSRKDSSFHMGPSSNISLMSFGSRKMQNQIRMAYRLNNTMNTSPLGWKTRSGPTIPTAGHLEGDIFWHVWFDWTHFGSLLEED